MPKLFTTPEVSDYFVDYDFGPEPRESGILDEKILSDYEDGKCIYFRNWKVDFDRDFFSGLDLEPNRAAKKLKSKVGTDGQIDPEQLHANLALCVRDPLTAALFPAHAAYVSAQVTPILTRIFGGLEFLDRRLTWRMLETVHEDLHIDVYPEEKSDHQVRMFVNLDSAARIWNTSYTLEELLARFGHLLTDRELAQTGPGMLCRYLNQRVYGGLSNAGRDGQPRHVAFFEPGEVWMVDSRKISHQIFYGRRALSLDFLANPASMARPEKYYLRAVEDYRRRRGFSWNAEHEPALQLAPS